MDARAVALPKRLRPRRRDKPGHDDLLWTPMDDYLRRDRQRSVRRHEDGEAEAGQMVQGLVDADQGPEPGMRKIDTEIGRD